MAPILEPYLEPGRETLCHDEGDVPQVQASTAGEGQQPAAGEAELL
jgi:hypothetical protein